MNRQQAEHILDAYVRIRMNEADKDASDALRAVILDAMTEYRTSGITYPGTTYLGTTYLGTTTGTPTYHKPIVTCGGES